MFTIVITSKKAATGTRTLTTTPNRLMKFIQDGKVVAMTSEGFDYVTGRVAKSPKSRWVAGLENAKLLEFTPFIK